MFFGCPSNYYNDYNQLTRVKSGHGKSIAWAEQSSFECFTGNSTWEAMKVLEMPSMENFSHHTILDLIGIEFPFKSTAIHMMNKSAHPSWNETHFQVLIPSQGFSGQIAKKFNHKSFDLMHHYSL